MDGRQAVCRSAGGEGGGQRAGQSPSRGSRAVERSENTHLPPHLQPLPDTSDEEEDDRRSRAVPLGSGSTQEWTATERCGSREPSYGQSYTQLLQQGLSGDEGDGGVNLTFGLCSGRSSTSMRTVLVDNRPDDDGGQVTAVARPSKSPASSVRQLRVVDDKNDGDAPDVGGNDQDLNDDDCGGGEDNAGQVSPSKQSSMGGKGGRAKASVRNGRRGKKVMGKGSDVEADGDAEGGRYFWSVDDMVALIRAKRDQDAHLHGMGTAYVRMKPREWKWLDVEQRLKKVGVEREAERCGKKWDNLMQQFKKFTGKERLSKGFSFNMDRAVYDKILGSTSKSHTINPKNVADTGAPGGVRLPSANSGDPESVGDGDAAVGLDDDDDGSTREVGVAAQGIAQEIASRSPAHDERGASTAVAARAADVAKAGATTAGGASQCAEGGRSVGAATVGASHAVEGARAGGGNAGEGSRAGAVAGVGEDDEALANRVRQRSAREGIDAASKLWVNDIRFWNETEGNAIVKLMQKARLYLVAEARGVQPPAIRRSIVLLHTTIPQHKIDDESEFSAAQDRALKVQIIALRLPLWFVGAYIEDRHEDDELAAYQEASVQRLVGAFTSAVSTAEGVDGGRVSHERLKSVAEAMRVMLAATMWFMRMGSDDRRAHYVAWVFVQLTVKPTLIASMHRSLDARRHIVQAATAITDKLAKPPITLLAPPLYISDWASIGVKFSHDATLSSPMEAQKLDWLSTGPPQDGDDAIVNDDMSAGGS
ncbi:hypothetical protein CBR_g24337 [Chara braunii]|uniref:Myb/SANT-like DNA-binding domain-containing protein n=1 Tax=Chara braunii TaxID=69332 RepID=A0A388JMG3_CHABU|nr:hypothetical protein CBR_g24337 [Chara braunii]|eukprot:GBG58988.1 hypothetical protein CBR_g24337 [Chara braunii]